MVFPEDRTRFDELVYRRDPYRESADRLRVSCLGMSRSSCGLVSSFNVDVTKVLVVLRFLVSSPSTSLLLGSVLLHGLMFVS